jgi:predicted DNA repair protein MutK
VLAQAVGDDTVDLVAFEKEKIRGAIRTDLILSAEIVVIALGTVADAPFATRVVVLVGIAAIMTVGVYGLVAGIVKLDDLGAWLGRRTQPALQALGRGLLRLAPWLMKALSVAGTAAMFLVGGGIVVHGIGALHHAIEGAAERLGDLPGVGAVAAALTPMLLNALAGIVVGAVVLGAVTLWKRVSGRAQAPA